MKTDDKGHHTLTVIAAFTGRRWVDSEKARKMLHKGDRLSIFAPATGARGEAVLTDSGHLRSEEPNVGEGEGYGLEFQSSVQLGPDSAEPPEGGGGEVLATWTKSGASPHWIKMTALPKPAKGSAYWRVARAWLRERGWPPRAVETMSIDQILRADVNGNGKEEVFLSLSGDDGRPAHETAGKRYYSYLLMLSADTKGITRTIVVNSDDWAQYSQSIIGLGDFDHDGWAEVITSGGGLDAEDVTLFHWNGHRFVRGGSCGWGA